MRLKIKELIDGLRLHKLIENDETQNITENKIKKWRSSFMKLETCDETLIIVEINGLKMEKNLPNNINYND